MFDYSFIDLDNTLFDTTKFEAEIFEIFTGHGVPLSDSQSAFYKSLCTISPRQYDYSFEEHVDFVRQLGYDISSEVMAELNGLLEKQYLFPDAKEFVDYIRDLSRQTILLSAGDANFQRNKIDHSRIAGWFDEVVIIPGRKDEYISDNYEFKRILFINDNIPENKTIVANVKNAAVITRFNKKRYAEDEAKELGVPYFETLTEIKNYVQGIV